jgi:hypothetical protein
MLTICVYCKGSHVNLIVLIVNQVWPLLNTKPNFKVNDVEI